MPRRINGRLLIWVLVIATTFAITGKRVARAADAPAKRPNFVFLISDDQRWDSIGVSGNPKVKTPVLDALAKEGVYFRQGMIDVSQCAPSRSTLLLGLTQHAHR